MNVSGSETVNLSSKLSYHFVNVIFVLIKDSRTVFFSPVRKMSQMKFKIKTKLMETFFSLSIFIRKTIYAIILSQDIVRQHQRENYVLDGCLIVGGKVINGHRNFNFNFNVNISTSDFKLKN